MAVWTRVVVDAECDSEAISQADAKVWVQVPRLEIRLAAQRRRYRACRSGFDSGTFWRNACAGSGTDKLSFDMVDLVYGPIVPCVNMHKGIMCRGMVFSWYCQRDESTNMLIRAIEERDIPVVARLLNVLAREFIVHESTPEGRSTFLRENDAEGIRRYIGMGHVYQVAESDGEIAGFIAVRERKHLFHMFVGVKWQRQGLGRKLWEVARDAAIEAGGSGSFTVNASNFAVPVYESMGFVRTAPMQCMKGLYFNPMELDLGS